MTRQENIRAVNRTIRALGLDKDAKYAANVALLRTLARQMDAADGDPSTRLSAAFLSALKDIHRATPDLPASEKEPDALSKFLEQYG